MWIRIDDERLKRIIEILSIRQDDQHPNMPADSVLHAQELQRWIDCDYNDPARAAFIEAARDQYEEEGDREIAIDDDAILSRADEHAFVMAWVYVRNEDAGITEEEDEDERANDPHRMSEGELRAGMLFAGNRDAYAAELRRRGVE